MLYSTYNFFLQSIKQLELMVHQRMNDHRQRDIARHFLSLDGDQENVSRINCLLYHFFLLYFLAPRLKNNLNSCYKNWINTVLNREVERYW